jgi:hypothetical protein
MTKVFDPPRIPAQLEGLTATDWRLFRSICVRRGITVGQQLAHLVAMQLEQEAKRTGKR